MEKVLNFCLCTLHIDKSFLDLLQCMTLPTMATSSVSGKLPTGILKLLSSYYSFYYFCSMEGRFQYF